MAEVGAPTGPNYWKDVFYVVMLVVVAAVPLVFLYLFNMMTKSPCTCPKACETDPRCQCKPKIGSDGKPDPDVDCTNATVVCKMECAFIDALELGAVVADAAKKALTWLEKNGVWLGIVGALGILFTVLVVVLVKRGRGQIRETPAEGGGTDAPSTWDTIRGTFNERKKLQNEIRKNAEKFNEMERQYTDAVNQMKTREITNPTEWTKADGEALTEMESQKAGIKSMRKISKRLLTDQADANFSRRLQNERYKRQVRSALDNFNEYMDRANNVLDRAAGEAPADGKDTARPVEKATADAKAANEAYTESVGDAVVGDAIVK